MQFQRRSFLKGILAGAGSLPALSALTSVRSYAMPLRSKPTPELWDNSKITCAWIGHSTILINMFGVIILTDPVLADTIGIRLLGSVVGINRQTRPALTLKELPKPDIVLVSHAHMDHCDYPTLEALTELYPQSIDAVCAFGNDDIINDLSWKSLSILDWEDSVTLSGVHIKAHEVRHHGWRYPWEIDRSKGNRKTGRSYNSYIISHNNKTLLFGGDTSLTDSFKRVNQPIDLAFMPIGAYDPWIWNHCSPEQALQMAMDMNATIIAPMHCMTFSQSNEPFSEPMQRMIREAKRTSQQLAWYRIGDTYIVGEPQPELRA